MWQSLCHLFCYFYFNFSIVFSICYISCSIFVFYYFKFKDSILHLILKGGVYRYNWWNWYKMQIVITVWKMQLQEKDIFMILRYKNISSQKMYSWLHQHHRIIVHTAILSHSKKECHLYVKQFDTEVFVVGNLFSRNNGSELNSPTYSKCRTFHLSNHRSNKR